MYARPAQYGHEPRPLRRTPATDESDGCPDAEALAERCLPCPKRKEEAYADGPRLGSIVSKPDKAILLDLLDPSGHIESEFVSYIVATTDGQTFTGVLASDSATSVTLRKEKGVIETILREDIEIMQASHLSMMPSNLHEQITPGDLADLIAFLRQAFAKPGSKKAKGTDE